MSKPKVSSAKWYKMWEQDDAVCYYDENNLSFLKLKLPNQRVKYFYGELAHTDAARFASDNGHEGLWLWINGIYEDYRVRYA